MPIAMMLSRGYSDTSRSAGSITPADELSSWLGDDVCTVCGTGVPAGHLHCSIECRQDDAAASAAQQTRATTLTPAMAAVNGIDATPTKSAAASSAPTHSAVRKPSRGHGKSYSRSPMPGDAGNDEAGEKFRYAPPSSPSVTAKYSAALTSPALAAHDRTAAAQRSPSGLKHEVSEARRNLAHGANGSASEQEWQSSSESSHGASRIQESRTRTSNRRSSSRSTFSSTSEAFSTDPSTPSPALRAHAEHDDDFDDFEPTVLDLPPSIVPAMLMNASGQRDATIIASARNAPVKASSPPRSVQNKPSSVSGMTDAQQKAAMSYARRPSRTNMPAPVLFTSPVLATTVMKKSPPSGRSLRSPGLRSSTLAKTSASASLHGSSLTSPSSTYVHRRQRPIAMRKMPSSPPQVASAASSAGKTLRGVSPTYEQSSQEGAGIGSGPLCGRFGCRGVSNSVDSDEERLHPDGLAHSHVNASQHARPNMLHGHKHTHSAAANLHHLGSSQYHSHRSGVLAERNVLPSVPAKATTVSKLVMTPASAMQRTEDKVGTAAQAEEQVSEALRDLVSPPRGRSKARGRSSTSRRSPSPPRGVARRGISLEHGDSSKTGSIDDHAPSRSMSSERSSPISMPRQSPASDAVPVKTDRNETDEPRGRRGRSPTARGRASVRSTSRSRAPAPLAQQRDASSKRNAGSAAIRGSIAQATAADSSPDVSHDSALSRGDRTIRVMPRQDAEEVATSSGYDDVELDEL